jgi:hypothetical protein
MRSGPGGSGTGTGTPGPGAVVFESSMRIVHGLALVLWSRLMFDDGAVVNVEPARAHNANPRRATRLRFLGPFTRRLARAKTPTHVGNGHVRVMNVLRRLETLKQATASPPTRCASRPSSAAPDLRSSLVVGVLVRFVPADDPAFLSLILNRPITTVGIAQLLGEIV